MLKIFSLLILFAVVKSHQGKIQNEGDAQSALMPQELNPAFASDKDSPWHAVIPIRHRREVDSDPIRYRHEVDSDVTICKVKTYSRIVACIVLAISAIVEVVVYFIEMYTFEV